MKALDLFKGWPSPPLLALFLLLATGCQSGRLDAQPLTGDHLPVSFGLALDGQADGQRLARLQKNLDIPLGLVVIFLQWPEDPTHDNFPAEQLAAIRTAGAWPCLTWEPMTISNGQEQTIPARLITDGSYDPYLRGFARRAAAFNQPLIIRFAHEMNLSRYHWGTTAEEYGPASPGIYRRMFRHVVEIFRQEGADQVLFAFNPNAESVPSPQYDPEAWWNQPTNYYPGDDVVDLLGMDGYNWGGSRTMAEHGWQSRFQSFAEIFSPLHQTLKQLAPAKPIYVFETASVAEGGDKTAWVVEAAATARQWGLAGLVWFDNDKEEDWRLRSGTGPAALEALRRMAAGRGERP